MVIHDRYGIDLTPVANYDSNGTIVEGSTDFFSSVQAGATYNAWGCHAVLSLGFLLALAITVPMGIFNLDDNMIIQTVAFIITLVCWAIWFIACFFSDTFSAGTWHIPAIKSGADYTSQVSADYQKSERFSFGTSR